jgi:hypothetical protein
VGGLYALAAGVLLAAMKLLCSVNRKESMKQHQRSQHLQQSNTPSATTSSSSHCDPAHLLRPLVLYMQWMLIIATINVQWPVSMLYALKGLAWVWAPTSPDTLAPDCITVFSTSVPWAIQKVIFYLAVPVAMLVMLVAVEWASLAIHKCRLPVAADAAVPQIINDGSSGSTTTTTTTTTASSGSMADHLIASGMVVTFFFLPSVVRTLFSMFACMKIDTPVPPPYEAAAVGWFWSYDTNTPCLQGLHLRWALGLGIPLITIVCLCLPAAILCVTLRNRSRLDDPDFMMHYGFLYRYYTPKHCYYDAVVVVETMVLVAISVFGFALGPHLQSILLNVALLVFAVLLLAVRPHAQARAAHVAYASAGCLYMTSYTVLSLPPLDFGIADTATDPADAVTGSFETAVEMPGLTAQPSDDSPGDAVLAYMSVLVVMINGAFVGVVVWQLLKAIDWKAAARRVLHFGPVLAASAKSIADQLKALLLMGIGKPVVAKRLTGSSSKLTSSQQQQRHLSEELSSSMHWRRNSETYHSDVELRQMAAERE